MNDELASWESSAPLVYGEGEVPFDDPAEVYHEASKIYPGLAAGQMAGAYRLTVDRQLQQLVTRSAKRYSHRPAIALPEPALSETPLGRVLRGRRTCRAFTGQSISLPCLSTLLFAAYGVNGRAGASEQTFRCVPSGGALYPLELYPVVLQVDGLAAGLYHYDPTRSVLEELRAGHFEEVLLQAITYPELTQQTAVVVLITALFWRTRFKYGQRGYRFALLEAGHLAQNLLLAAEAHGLGGAPIGGFYECRVDAFLAVDGVNESTIYAVSVGGKATHAYDPGW